MSQEQYTKSPGNERRARRALGSVEHYAEGPIKGDDVQLFTVDLLCDLQHLCAQRGWDFQAALGHAQQHFDVEKLGDDGE